MAATGKDAVSASALVILCVRSGERRAVALPKQGFSKADDAGPMPPQIAAAIARATAASVALRRSSACGEPVR